MRATKTSRPSRPTGPSTRRSSASSPALSGVVQSTPRHQAASKVPSANGSACPMATTAGSPNRRRLARPRPASARRRPGATPRRRPATRPARRRRRRRRASAVPAAPQPSASQRSAGRAAAAPASGRDRVVRAQVGHRLLGPRRRRCRTPTPSPRSRARHGAPSRPVGADGSAFTSAAAVLAAVGGEPGQVHADHAGDGQQRPRLGDRGRDPGADRVRRGEHPLDRRRRPGAGRGSAAAPAADRSSV